MLQQKTLVLNRSWVPITLTTVRRAVVLLAMGAARAVHPATYEVADWNGWIERGPQDGDRLRGVDFHLPVPEVIVLSGYNGFPDRKVAFTRRNVYRRDNFRCMYCGVTAPHAKLTIDHVIPRARGGENTWENCVTACVRCNSHKADRLPQDIGYRLERTPAAPRWPGGLDPVALRTRPVWGRFLRPSRRS